MTTGFQAMVGGDWPREQFIGGEISGRLASSVLGGLSVGTGGGYFPLCGSPILILT